CERVRGGAGGPAPLLRWWREPFSEKPKPPRTSRLAFDRFQTVAGHASSRAGGLDREGHSFLHEARHGGEEDRLGSQIGRSRLLPPWSAHRAGFVARRGRGREGRRPRRPPGKQSHRARPHQERDNHDLRTGWTGSVSLAGFRGGRGGRPETRLAGR